MTPIKSFAEAKRKLEELDRLTAEVRQFLDMADNTISAVNMLKGEGVGTRTQTHSNVVAPTSWADRVLEVFKQAVEPMKQKEAALKYAQTGWPRPEGDRELYTAISGAIAYLFNKKQLLVKTERGYTIKK